MSKSHICSLIVKKIDVELVTAASFKALRMQSLSITTFKLKNSNTIQELFFMDTLIKHL